MSDIAIRVENLGKQYRIGQRETAYKTLRESIMNLFARRDGKPDTIWALKDVSFEVKRGKVVGIIGRNGAGKSTLLKILTRITEPTEGHAEIHGRVGALLEVGTGFHPELTGRENIFLNGAVLGMKKTEIQRKFDEILAFSEIEKFIDTPVKRYSSGMRVRLAFAVAAHLEPEILLVDEVLSVGDAAFQKKCLGKMDDVARMGRTVLFVSHRMGAIQNLCQSAFWLSDGQIEATGQVYDVVQSYLSTVASKEKVFSVKYPNDPSASMQFLSARLRGPLHGVFSISDNLVFELEILTRTVLDGAYVTVNIRDSTDSIVYWSADIGSERFKNQVTGYSKLICECPSYLLTPGRYSVNFGIVSLGRGIIYHIGEQRIIFEIEDRESLLSIHGIKYPGVTAAPSQWSVKIASSLQKFERS